MQKPVQIEGLVGEIGSDDVPADGKDHGNEVDFKGVDRKFHRIHTPFNPGIEGRRNGFKKGVQRLHHAVLLQDRINVPGPVPLENQSEQGSSGSQNDRAPRAGQIAEAAVEPEHHDRPRPAEPDRAHDRRKHVDVVQLGEKERNDQEENRNADARQTQQQQMQLLRQMPLEERQNHVLHQG